MEAKTEELFTEEEQTESSSAELPEDYKPYSQFPWHEIPEEARERFLSALKKFHGDLTRKAQEAKAQLAEAELWKQKAEWWDALVQQPWFQEAYKRRFESPAESSTSSEGSSSIPDLEPETLKAIDRVIQDRLGPLEERISTLQQQLVAEKTRAEVEKLKRLASERGWPDPEDVMTDIVRYIREGRASNAEDAYRLAIFEEVPKTVESKLRQQMEEEKKKKAGLAGIQSEPGMAKAPGEEQFEGDQAVAEALRAAMAEISRGGK